MYVPTVLLRLFGNCLQLESQTITFFPSFNSLTYIHTMHYKKLFFTSRVLIWYQNDCHACSIYGKTVLDFNAGPCIRPYASTFDKKLSHLSHISSISGFWFKFTLYTLSKNRIQTPKIYTEKHLLDLNIYF